MKQLSPYIFPLVVVAIVFFLVFRWYSDRARLAPQVGEGISIENLSEEELKNAVSGVGDFTTIQLEDVAPESESDEPSKTPSALSGVVRYEIVDERVKVSVIAQAIDSEETYYVWLQSEGSDSPSKAFQLVEGKGGLVGSGAFSAKELPVDVFVTLGDTLADDMENVVLKGRIEATSE